MTDTPAIAPCWWCGAACRVVSTGRTSHVECAVCGAESPAVIVRTGDTYTDVDDAAIRVHNAGPRGGGK